ncbi:MAG: Cys-tRNA(Pro) deacylase [Clostridiales bacterium]|nr:Cys-tRNA(Pro) deacylase [Clostridiales bacterium]
MAKKTPLTKTNAMRQLDTADIPYETSEYNYDESDLSGEHVANELGISKDEIFKTLVTYGDNNMLFVFVVPVSGNLDLKKAAAVSGNKKIEMIHVKDIISLTGYLRGGCSPIGMKKNYSTYIDETAVLFEKIYFSAGKRGVQIIMDPTDLADFINADFADLTQD